MQLRRDAALAGVALLAAATSCPAAPVTLAAGAPIELVLQHHVTSAYVPAGSPIYFRVGRNVEVDGRVAIVAGTLVEGQMTSASDRGMVGRSGTMSLGVRLVRAVDGTMVPIEAEVAKQGRSRAGATVGWTLFWGLPGLITKGVNPYLQRGAAIEATALAATMIDPDAWPAAPDTPPGEAAPTALAIEAHRFEKSHSTPYTLDIERGNELGSLIFSAHPSPETGDPAAFLGTVTLSTVDGEPVPVPVTAKSATADSFSFDAWSILQFCRDGATDLGFRAATSDGRAYNGDYRLTIKIKKKLPKQKSGE